jgi:hypothetical protein
MTIRYFTTTLALVGAALLSSCGTTKVSNPPAAALILRHEQSFGDGGFVKRYTLPPGRLSYIKTNNRGHYYQSATPGTLVDFPIRLKQTGGVIWRHGKPSPDRMYRMTVINTEAYMSAPGLKDIITLSGPPPELRMEVK